MYKKFLLLLTMSTLIATIFTLSCSLSGSKTSYAAPRSVVAHSHTQIVVPGSNVVPLDGLYVEAMAAVTSSDIWIAGEYSSSSNQSSAFYEHFDGLRWQVVDTHIAGAEAIL